MHALKYHGWSELAEFMAGRMARDPVKHHEDPVIVPVPTTRWRRRIRGYNQAGVLARALARHWELPVREVLRREGGRTQVNLAPRERLANVQGAFRLRTDSISPIRDREVILVDDVLTTGATALAASRALEGAGPSGIHLRTFARALPFATGRSGR